MPKCRPLSLIGRALLLLVLTTSVASAAPDARDRARALVVQGAKLLEAGDFGSALARFDEAYATFPSPKVHFNRALALDGLGRQADAFDAFTRFVQEAEGASPQHLGQAQREMHRLRRLIALVEISSDDASGAVFIDGEPRGTTPLHQPIALQPGRHEIVLTAPGFPPESRIVILRAGEQTTVRIGRRNEASASRDNAPAVGRPPPPQPAVAEHRLSANEEGQRPREDQEAVSWRRSGAWLSLATTLGAAGFAVYESIQWKRYHDDFGNLRGPAADNESRRLCGESYPMRGTDGRCEPLYKDGQRAMLLSITGYAVAAALGTVSAVLFSKSEAPRSPAGVAWTCGTHDLRTATCRMSF